MSVSPSSDRPRGPDQLADASWDASAGDHDQSRRDWKRLFLVTGLGGLSWVATYVGMLELIEANMGDLPLVHKLIIGFSVAMLMVMVVWLLDQLFSETGWVAKSLYAAGYVFLTVISVGFGFGFYWKVLESRSEASRSAESAVGQVQTSLHAAMTRLEQLQGTLDSLTGLSSQKADTERQAGTSCPNSRPGDGPRRKMRDDDAARFKFAADFVKGRVGTVRDEIADLNGDLGKIVKDDKTTVDAKSGTRNEFMRTLGRKLDMTVTGFNAFRTDPQLKQIRADLNERSDKVTFTDQRGGTYTCPDGQLTTALKGVVRAIDELPTLEKPKIAAVEGSEAVIEAFRRLTATFYGALSFKLPPSPEELRELQKRAVQSVDGNGVQQAKLTAMAEQAGLSKRDYVPLAIAIFVDICLLLVSIRQVDGNRLNRLIPKMRAAERGPMIQILSRFNEIHRDKQMRENFEVFRHVVFDFHGDYYAAVPLNTPYRPNPRNGEQRLGYGVSDAQALLQEAHLLVNLFSSFEREKIFTRVHSPLLTTKAVQKRLRRQGSKFATAEAFRLYRFRNGAWSDIILGAVMGAARRVEAEKRRQTARAEAMGLAEPRLPEPDQPHGERHFEPRAGSERRREEAMVVLDGGLGFSLHGPGPFAPPRQAWEPPFASGRPREGTLAAALAAADAEPTRREADLTLATRMTGLGNSAPAQHGLDLVPGQASDPRDGARTGNAMPTVMPENVVLHPAMARSAQVAEPELAPSEPEPSVTVAAVRETVTFTLPVSEAQVPKSLLSRLAGRLEQTASSEASAAGRPTDKSLPPPLPPRPNDA